MNISYFYDNIFFKKSEGQKPDEFMNTSYWLIMIAKNILKFIFAVSLFNENNYGLFILLFICPLIKFFAVGLGNIYKFKQYNKANILIILLVLIIIIESLFELPSYILLPKNHIYLHTNYYKIYDLAKYRQVEISTELLESAIVVFYLFMSFSKGNVNVVHILTFTFCLVVFVYYITAEVYFMCFYEEEVREVDEYGRTLKRYRNERESSNTNRNLNQNVNTLKKQNKNRDDSSSINFNEKIPVVKIVETKPKSHNILNTSTDRYLIIDKKEKDNENELL